MLVKARNLQRTKSGPNLGTQIDTAEKLIEKPKVNDSPSIEDVMKSFHAEKAKITARDFSVRSIEYSKGSGSFISRFMNDGNFRSASISGINAFLHSLTVATAFTPGLKKVNGFIDKSAFFFTKIVSPFVSFGISAGKALIDKKPVEALIKAIPPILLPFVGDANIDTVFGFCLGLNQPYDMASDRIKAREVESSAFANHVQEKNKTSLGNAQLMLNEMKNIYKDFFAGKLNLHSAGFIVNTAMMLIGSLPMLLFASQQRNTSLAKFFGILRNCGGILGDLLFVTQKGNFHKLIVGILCSLGAVSNVTKRLVDNDMLTRVFIHLGAALDVAGYTVWNAWSDKKG